MYICRWPVGLTCLYIALCVAAEQPHTRIVATRYIYRPLAGKSKTRPCALSIYRGEIKL